MSSPPSISPALFLDCNGEPMRFYIRPGPAKVQLHDVITSGGGFLCRTREPGAILLAGPHEETKALDNSAQFYVSTQYIWDCVKENQQLDEKDYRLTGGTTEKIQTRALRSREGAVGRMSYTAAEDEAILNFISKRLSEARGNAVWQLMAKQKITSHSWQSMKDRYLKHLRNRPAKSKMGQLEFVSQSTPTKKQKDLPQQVTLEQNAKLPENDASASAAADQQAASGVPPDASSKEKSHNTEAKSGDTSTDVATEQQNPLESTHAEANNVDTSTDVATEQQNPLESTHAEENNVDTSTDVATEQQTPPESTHAEANNVDTSTDVATEQQNPLESTHTETNNVDTSTDVATEQQNPLESTHTETNNVDTSTDVATEQPTPLESTQGDTAALSKDGQAASFSRTSTTEEESDENQRIIRGHGDGVLAETTGTSLQTSKAPTKRRLGILARAVSEFRDSLWSENDSQPETAPSDGSDSESEVSGGVPRRDSTAGPPQQKKRRSSRLRQQETGAGNEKDTGVKNITSCHQFLFDTESQQVDDLSGASGKEGGAASSSQSTNAEGERLVFQLMKHSGKNLIEVIKALLKTSGDFAAAGQHLSQGSFPEPRWTKREDQLLLTADPSCKCQLEEKYGAEAVSARISFLR